MNAVTPSNHFDKRRLLSGSSTFPLIKPEMAFGLEVGMHFNITDVPCRLDAIHDDGDVELLNLKTMTRVRIHDDITGEVRPANMKWMREAYHSGILTQLCHSEAELQQMNWALSGRFGDMSISRANWAARLAYRAIEQGVKLSKKACDEWVVREYGSDPLDRHFPRPSGSSLRRWIASLKSNGKKSWTLVTRRGRPDGRTSLDPRVAKLVMLAAMFYWTRPRCKIIEAEAFLSEKMAELNASLPTGTEHLKQPSGETLRKRIHKLRSFDTYAAKFGIEQAKAMFGGSGEPMQVDQFLQVVLMDSTVLEQAIVFDSNWQLPATRVGITLLMDVYSRAVLSASLFAGSPRWETSAETIISCMMPPPEIEPDMLERFPGLVNIFGKPAAVLPDNATSLLSPSSTPSLNDAGITLLLPPIEFPEAKAILERFIRTLKEALASLPGTVIDPKRALELGYDAIGDAALTLSQMRSLVWQAINTHNTSPCQGLEGRSPLQVITETSHRRATPAFEDMDRVKLILGRTISVLVTRDGVEHEGIRYRNAEAITRFLDNNLSREAVRKKSGFTRLSIEARGKRNDGNLDTIQIYDPMDEVWHTLHSTQPDYTNCLCYSDHKEFQRQAKRRNEKFATEADRLRSRATTLKLIDKLAPQASFRQRKAMAQLHISQQFRKLAGDALPMVLPDDISVAVAPQVAPETGRLDSGIFPVREGAKKQSPSNYQAPDRPDDYYKSVPVQAGPDFDWDGIDLDEDNDPLFPAPRVDDAEGSE